MSAQLISIPPRKNTPSPGADRILDVAERLFAEAGFAATPMRRIANEAGVNVATVYYHCGSKEQLFGAIYGRAIGRLFEFVSGTLATGGEFADVVSQAVDGVVEYFVRNSFVARLMMRARLGETPGAEFTDISYGPLFEVAAAEMTRRAELGEMRRVDSAAFVEAAAGVIFHLVVDLGAAPDPARVATAKEHARLFILGAAGIVRGGERG